MPKQSIALAISRLEARARRSLYVLFGQFAPVRLQECLWCSSSQVDSPMPDSQREAGRVGDADGGGHAPRWSPLAIPLSARP
eukprot:5286601-Amphidinium_carterae.2